jgi:hypothetical protein
VSTVKSVAGSSVTYRRGVNTVSLTAVKSVVRVVLDGDDGTSVEADRVDWLIAAADLVLAGSQTEPVEGDQVDETVGSSTYTYELMPLGTDACFRRMDPQGQGLRAHSKLVQIQ